ncbi:MAG: glycosyl transferase family 2 [Pseudonocardiales bacterium]|nr:glycosyl transferase family 2 [Pseudonocardiales bacterium]
MSAAAEIDEYATPTEGALGVVVVSFGSYELLEKNLTALDAAALDARVVVVDNFHSTAERGEITRLARARGWTLVPMATNVGFGPAANTGVATARALGCDTFLLLNPDALVTVDVVHEMWRSCAGAHLTAVSPKILRPDGTVWFRGSDLNIRSGDVGRSADAAIAQNGWLTAACLMMHAELWDRIGGFDPDYFLYWEDVDLSRRCVAAGGRLEVRHDLKAVHDVGGTQGVAGKSDLYMYYNARNRLLFAAKHLRRRDLLRWMILTPAATLRILRRGGGGRRLLRSPRLVLSGLRGAAAGLAAATLVLSGRHGAGPDHFAGPDRRPA